MLIPIYQKPAIKKMGIRYMTEEVYQIFSSDYMLKLDKMQFKDQTRKMVEDKSLVIVDEVLMTKHEFEQLKKFLRRFAYGDNEVRRNDRVGIFERLKRWFIHLHFARELRLHEKPARSAKYNTS